MSETIAQSQSENYSKSVGTSAVVLAKGGGTRQSGSGLITVGGSIDMPRYVTVHNNHGSQVLYLGWGSDVSTSNGLPVPAGEYRTLRVWYDDELWAIASGADTDTRVYVLHGKGDPPFSPLDLSPTLWVDASDASTITTDVGVSVWADKSGNGYDLTQATGSAQPKTGTATINGLNVLEYDGADTQSLVNTTVPIQTNGPYTVLMVQEINASDTAAIPIASKATTAYGFVGESGSSNTTIYQASNWGTLSLYVNGTEFTGTTRDDVYTAFTNSPAVVRQQDILAATSSYNGLRVGYNGGVFNLSHGSKVAEVIVVDSPTAQQISDTETYLADKWGITLS